MKTVKAKNITNSIISILNEDMFAKYTLSQLYDKLGEEEFMDYLEKICTKAIKELDTVTDLKNAKPVIIFNSPSTYIIYRGKKPPHKFLEKMTIIPGAGRDEKYGIEVNYYISDESGHSDHYMTESIFSDKTNIATLLSGTIKYLYGSYWANKERESKFGIK